MITGGPPTRRFTSFVSVPLNACLKRDFTASKGRNAVAHGGFQVSVGSVESLRKSFYGRVCLTPLEGRSPFVKEIVQPVQVGLMIGGPYRRMAPVLSLSVTLLIYRAPHQLAQRLPSFRQNGPRTEGKDEQL